MPKSISKIILSLMVVNLLASTVFAAAEEQWPNTTSPVPTQITNFAGAHDANFRPFVILTYSESSYIVGVQTNDGAADLYFYKLMPDGTVGDPLEGWTSPAILAGGGFLIDMEPTNDDGAFIAYGDTKVTKVSTNGTISSPRLFDTASTGGCGNPFVTGLTPDRVGGVYVSWICDADEPYVSHLNSDLSVNSSWTGTVGTVKGRLIPSDPVGRVTNDGVPVVVVDANTSNLLVYTTGDFFYSGGGYAHNHVYVSTLTSDGALTGFSIPSPNYVTLDANNTVTVLSDDAGGLYIIYLNQEGQMIQLQQVDSSGNILSGNGFDVAPFDYDNHGIYDLKAAINGDDIFVFWGSDDDTATVQKIGGSDGVRYWGTNGFTLSNVYSIPNDPYQFRTPSIIPDGVGGAMFVFNNDQNQVVAQRIDENGDIDWGSTGVLFTSYTDGDDYDPVISLTGNKKEAVVVWYGQAAASSNTSEEVFAQFIKTVASGGGGGGCSSSGPNEVCGSQELICAPLSNTFGTAAFAPADFQIGDDGSRNVNSVNDTVYNESTNSAYFEDDNDSTFDDATDRLTISSNTTYTCSGRSTGVQLSVNATPFVNGSSQGLISYGSDNAVGGTGSAEDYYGMLSIITNGVMACGDFCTNAYGAVEGDNAIKHGENNFFANNTGKTHAVSFDNDAVLLNEANATNTVVLYSSSEGFDGTITVPGLDYALALPANLVYTGSFTSTVTYTLSS